MSQVLPILVMCLLAKPDSTLIIEQPELHLNPLVQTRLGDFFLSMALSHKQCIIQKNHQSGSS
ncbi:MAG: AAA family ATPase [Pseudomonadota bacterium]